MAAGVIDIDRQYNELESFKNDIHKAERDRNVFPNGDFLIDESQQYPHLHDVFIFVAIKPVTCWGEKPSVLPGRIKW